MAGSNRYFLYAESANVQDARNLLDKHSIVYNENDAIQTGIKELSFTTEPDVANSIAQEVLNGNLKVSFLNQRLPITGSIGSIAVLTAPPSSIIAGNQTTGSASALALATDTESHKVTIQADAANTDLVLIGNSTAQNVKLSAGASVDLEIDNLNKIYIKRNGSANVVVNYVGS